MHDKNKYRVLEQLNVSHESPYLPASGTGGSSLNLFFFFGGDTASNKLANIMLYRLIPTGLRQRTATRHIDEQHQQAAGGTELAGQSGVYRL